MHRCRKRQLGVEFGLPRIARRLDDCHGFRQRRAELISFTDFVLDKNPEVVVRSSLNYVIRKSAMLDPP